MADFSLGHSHTRSIPVEPKCLSLYLSMTCHLFRRNCGSPGLENLGSCLSTTFVSSKTFLHCLQPAQQVSYRDFFQSCAQPSPSSAVQMAAMFSISSQLSQQHNYDSHLGSTDFPTCPAKLSHLLTCEPNPVSFKYSTYRI